jgi:hypothetical protein
MKLLNSVKGRALSINSEMSGSHLHYGKSVGGYFLDYIYDIDGMAGIAFSFKTKLGAIHGYGEKDRFDVFLTKISG